jgi:ribosome maturation factor RimP
MEKLKNRIEQLVTDLGYYLYEIEYIKEHGDFVLRVMIENEKHIEIDDCIKVSKALGEMLDKDDPFKDPYNLEVTSPGAERELRTADQIKRAVGKNVYVETMEQKMKGELISYKDGFIELKMKNKRVSKINEIDVNLIRLAIVF